MQGRTGGPKGKVQGRGRWAREMHRAPIPAAPCTHPHARLPYAPTPRPSNLAARSFLRAASSASDSRRASTRSSKQAPRAEATALELWSGREGGHG